MVSTDFSVLENNVVAITIFPLDKTLINRYF